MSKIQIGLEYRHMRTLIPDWDNSPDKIFSRTYVLYDDGGGDIRVVRDSDEEGHIKDRFIMWDEEGFYPDRIICIDVSIINGKVYGTYWFANGHSKHVLFTEETGWSILSKYQFQDPDNNYDEFRDIRYYESMIPNDIFTTVELTDEMKPDGYVEVFGKKREYYDSKTFSATSVIDHFCKNPDKHIYTVVGESSPLFIMPFDNFHYTDDSYYVFGTIISDEPILKCNRNSYMITYDEITGMPIEINKDDYLAVVMDK